MMTVHRAPHTRSNLPGKRRALDQVSGARMDHQISVPIRAERLCPVDVQIELRQRGSRADFKIAFKVPTLAALVVIAVAR